MATRRPLLRLRPLNVHSTSLAVLALLACIYFLRVAQAVFIPVTTALVTACALAPIVRWLRRVLHIPKALGAAAILLLLCGLLGAGAYSLQPQLIRILDVVPRATAKFDNAMREHARDHNSALQKLDRAATEIERAASAAKASGAHPSPKAAAPPAAPAINVRDYIMMGTADAVAGFGQLIVVLALVFFLLISGDTFRLALVRASGESLANRKVTLRIFAIIERQVQRYLALQIATSALLGVLMGFILTALGLENAVFWACCGALLHMIPYFGPAVFLVIVSMVAYVQFPTWVPVLAVASSILVSTGVIGMLLVPWLTQKVSRLNAVTVFVSLLFWSWMWGTWGLLLGIPIMLALSVVCERIEGLQSVGHFLTVASPSQGPNSGPLRRPKRPDEPVGAELRTAPGIPAADPTPSEAADIS